MNGFQMYMVICIYLSVVSCALLYMGAHTEDLGLSWRRLCHCLQHQRLLWWHPLVSGGGRIGGVVAFSLQWKVGVVSTYTHMYVICCLVCVCMYVCLLTIKKKKKKKVCHFLFQNDANRRINNNHVETLTICEKMWDFLRSHSRH